MTRQMVLCPLIGSGEGAQAKVLRFEQALSEGDDLVHRVSAGAGDVIAVMTPGIYSISATMRFQCMADGTDPAPWSNGWGITLNTQQRPADWINNFPQFALAWALLPEPNERERQREPTTTLSWVGPLAPGDELRIESERPNPRVYQGMAADRFSFVRVVKLPVEMNTIFYAETTGTLTTSSETPADLPGLAVTIPAWPLRPQNALVTVNIPNPYAVGPDFPGGVFQVALNGAIQPAMGVFTYNEKVPDSTGRIPVTLVTKVALPAPSQAATIQVKWSGVRGSTVHLDSPTSLSVQMF